MNKQQKGENTRTRATIQNQYYVRNTSSVVSQIKPRATLGQRQVLIKPRTLLNIQQFSGKITPPQYKDEQDATHPGGGLTPRRDWAAGLFRTSSGCLDPTDADAGRTDVSVDPARRNDRRSSRRRRQRPRRRSLTLRLALQPLQTTASSRLQRRPSVPVPVRPGDRSALTPAVAHDGDLVVSRCTLAPVSSGEPTQHPAFHWQQRTGTAVPHSQWRQH